MTRTAWRPLGFFYFSLLFTLIVYWSISEKSTVKANLSNSTIQAQRPDTQPQGQEILLNGQRFSVAWSQWQQEGSIRTGISDTGAMQLLGLELLSTNQPDLQPISWFASQQRQYLPLVARFTAPYRYLDITDLISLAGGQIRSLGNTLEISFPPAQIANIRQGNQSWGKRIVIDVDRPTFWQVSQVPGEGIVTIAGTASPSLKAGFNSQTGSNTPSSFDQDDLGSSSPQSADSSLFSLESAQNSTKIKFNLPAAHNLRVFSLANPNRIAIDVRPDTMSEREIVWMPGIVWRQQLVRLPEAVFPVNWLEIELSSPKISLKPITSNPNTQQGTAPLVTTARNWQTVAAINGGFFNRNNQLPLGAIRQDNRWLSSPILNRGAIAWNSQGKVKLGRLSWQETLVTASGTRLPITYLNSGYIQSGMARYTPQWGPTYTPLTDNEIIIIVENEQVIGQKIAALAGKGMFTIPSDGYLLTIRNNSVSPSAFTVGTAVKLESRTNPQDFDEYANILGAGPLLLQNRQIVLDAAAEQFSQGFQQQQASRSSIGVTAKGTILLVAVHNRISGRGATLREMAQIMQQIGAVDALNLDGGSSTSLVLGGQLIDRSPVTAARVHNGIGVFVTP